jgi:drug/metabolite transporter (DMT)-like permease
MVAVAAKLSGFNGSVAKVIFDSGLSSLRATEVRRSPRPDLPQPVLATVVAYAWLDQRLGPQQLAGGAVVLAGILLAQTARE